MKMIFQYLTCLEKNCQLIFACFIKSLEPVLLFDNNSTKPFGGDYHNEYT